MSSIKKYWPEIVFVFFTISGIALKAIGVDYVEQLTPLYLLLNLGLLMYRYRDAHVLPLLYIAAGIGFFAELIGVQTGLLFGDYIYGTVLGPKLFDVPIMVGVMWALVMLVIWALLPGKLGISRIPLAASIAVLYDLILEHFATRFGLWNWEGSIPLSNYIGWFIVASCIASVYHYRGYLVRTTLLAQLTLPVHIVFFLFALYFAG